MDATNRYIYPSNNNLYSHVLNCKRQAKASVTGGLTSMLCTNQAGCTACKPGHFLTPNPIVPGTAMCTPCDGCPTSQCKANGCAACPNAVLSKLTPHPWGVTGMNGKAAMVCRNATSGVTVCTSRPAMVLAKLQTAVLPLQLLHTSRACLLAYGACQADKPLLDPPHVTCPHPWIPAPQPFKSRTGLLTTAVWPASEFGNCPAREL